MRISVETAVSMAVKLHKRGELEEARTLYDDILGVEPKHPDALHYLGVVLHQMGDSEHGLEYVEQSLALVPDHPGMLNNLGNINREMGKLESAEKIYRKVLEIEPNHADTLVNLGIILRNLKQPDSAMNALKKALKIDPRHAQAYHNLGNVLFDQKNFDDALTAYRKSEELAPADEASCQAIARLLYFANRKDEAIDVLKCQIKKDPDDARSRHMLAAYSRKNIPKRASDDYVRQLFDEFSRDFDESLSRLEYKAPQLICARVHDELGGFNRDYRVLDIGCGTGLCGPLVKPIADSLTGVDLSPGMLRKAKQRDVYDHLEEAELTRYMNNAVGEYDVVICVDTFCYFGDLSEAFKAAYTTLRPGGWFFFTVEQHSHDKYPDDHYLQHHGRYSHSKEYLVKALESAGLMVKAADDVALRMEEQKPVCGTLAVAQKS